MVQEGSHAEAPLLRFLAGHVLYVLSPVAQRPVH